MSTGTSYRESHASSAYGERYTNTYSHGYYFEQWNRLERPLLESIFKKLADNGAKRALDFACGTGRILLVAEEYFSYTVGVDVSEEMLKYARSKTVRSILREQDITNDPLDELFDLVTAFRFFVNAEPELRDSALEAISAVLEPNGVLLANVHINTQSPLGTYYRFRNSLPGTKPIPTLSYPDFAQLLEQHGLQIENTYRYSYLPRTGWRLSWLPAMLMEPVEQFCKSVSFMPASWAQSFLVLARKT